MKKWKDFFRRTGHGWLAAICVATVLLSALWTRQEMNLERTETPARADVGERMANVTPPPENIWFFRPAGGKILRPFSEEAVFFPEYRCYALHPAMDLAVEKGQNVYAAFDGHIHWEGQALYLAASPFTLRYVGVETGTCMDGQAVRKGAVIGKATGYVPYEGENILCLTLYKEEETVDLSFYFAE